MGLDCTFILPPDTLTPTIPTQLLERMPSFDPTTHSFRASGIRRLFPIVTGYELCEPEPFDNLDLDMMATSLEIWADLAALFRAYQQAGAKLKSSY